MVSIYKYIFINIQTTNMPRAQKKTSPLVERLVSGDRAGSMGGIQCNDPNGLALHVRGNMNGSGVYTNLVRLASQLQPTGTSTSTTKGGGGGGGGQPTSHDGTNTTGTHPPPLITIETDTTSILIKEYDGHTVAIRVPTVPESKNDTE